MPVARPQITAAAGNRRDQDIDLLSTLIARARQGEVAVQTHVADRLAAIGCHVDRLRYRPDEVLLRHEFAAAGAMSRAERESIVARLSGTGGGRSLILFAHPDSEPVAGLEAWSHDPFSARIANGRIHGWGVADDLAGVAIMVAALSAVRAAGLPLAGDVIIASTPSKRHAHGVAAVLDHGVTADAAIYLHPAESGAGMAEVKAFSSGLLSFEVEIAGGLPPTNEPGHTIFAHQAVNPIDKALVVHRALTELGARRAERVRHPRLERAVGRASNVLMAGVSCGAEARYDRVAERFVVRGSISFPPGEAIKDVQAELASAVAVAARTDPWLAVEPPRLTWVSGVSGAEVAEDHPLYRIVADVIEQQLGRAPNVNPLHTASDIRVPYVQKGIATVGLGPLGGDLTQNGRTGEWVDVEDYLGCIAITAGIIAAWCGPP
jgi:acetylornithine deacetylase/succinyl-diaminopimelate desuccinylase-like protein